ncbi:putative alcohol dehydrogenase [Aureobasidium pullulans]|nr:putative alcohol dehydrogenase [Aureobasidium pullulans]
MPSKDIILPATQRAIIATDAEGTLKISNDVPVVTLESDAVIVETAALALNPVDTKMLHGFLGPGCILGFDFAGVIVAVGSAVPESRGLAIGDRVFGSANGSDRRRPLAGAFAQYTTCSASMIIKMHPDMTFTRAAALGTALTSTGMALFRSLCIPGTLDKPILKSTWLLVYGGATSTGTMMIQLARRCGFKPITTCSPANFNLVKSYGAEEAFDYHSSTCAENIRKYTGNTLAYAADCVTVPSSTKACIAAIGRAGGRYVALDPYEEDLMTRKVVRPDWILATAVAGRGSSWPAPYGREPDMECRVWAEEYLASVERLIGSGADQIRSHPLEEREGGLEGIMSGIEEIRRKQVRGFKLVYPVEW